MNTAFERNGSGTSPPDNYNNILTGSYGPNLYINLHYSFRHKCTVCKQNMRTKLNLQVQEKYA